MFGLFKKKKNLVIVTLRSDEISKDQLQALEDQLKVKLPNKDVAVIAVSSNDILDVIELSQ